MAVDWTMLRACARRQRDLLTRGQCFEAGMSARAVDWRVGSARWTRVHAGVYLTRPGRDDWHTTALAALLRADTPDGVAQAAFCGASAGYLWGLERRPPGRLELLVPNRRTVTAPRGATVRRSMRWADLVDERAYPWRTSVPATVLDLATRGSAIDALSVVARAIQRELTTPHEVWREITARGGHRHSRVLRAALHDVGEGLESGAEVLYVRNVERPHGLPRARQQAPSHVGRLRRHDFSYDDFGLLVEVDGRLGHEQWRDRVRDGQRDRQLLTHRRTTTRVFWPDVAVTPCDTAQELASILGGRGWRGRPHPCRRSGCAVRPLSL
jgi:hypothetical protein